MICLYILRYFNKLEYININTVYCILDRYYKTNNISNHLSTNTQYIIISNKFVICK